MPYQNKLSRMIPDLPQGWYGYINTFGRSNKITLRDGTFTRNARCKDCRVLIPAKIPRFHVYALWRYIDGNYCVECGVKRLTRQRRELVEHVSLQQERISTLSTMLSVGEKIEENETYKNKMAMSRLGRQLER